jgi:uncharacterized membrane protein YdbT with pleckstrin-like domain
MVAAPIYFPDLREAEIQKVILFIESLILLFIWIYIFFTWIEFYFDVWIITDRKIINIEQWGLFNRQVGEFKYERIQDITVQIRGFIPTLLDYGDVHIQTAGAVSRYVFDDVPNPNEIKNMIMNLQKQKVQSETNDLGEMIRKEIHDELV